MFWIRIGIRVLSGTASATTMAWNSSLRMIRITKASHRSSPLYEILESLAARSPDAIEPRKRYKHVLEWQDYVLLRLSSADSRASKSIGAIACP